MGMLLAETRVSLRRIGRASFGFAVVAADAAAFRDSCLKLGACCHLVRCELSVREDRVRRIEIFKGFVLPRLEAQTFLLEGAPAPFMLLCCKAKAMAVGEVETVMWLNKTFLCIDVAPRDLKT